MRRTSPLSLTPWVRGLIIANAVVFLLTITVFTGPWFFDLFAFSPARAATEWWSFGTYMFLHGGFLHLAFNMLMLFVFGPAVEEEMGNWFGLYYFLCGLGGAVLSFALTVVTPVAPFVGASGAVLGVALAFAMRWPNEQLYIFPIPVPIKAKWLVIFLGTVDLLLAVRGANDGVAHLAHLGGLLFGFLYVKGEAIVMRRAQAALREARAGATWVRRRRELPPPRERARLPEAARATEHEVDRLLDKISASGLDSLTPDERRVLDEASRQLREH